ncbi:MAG: porin family protein [Maribacter sp.]|uniref:porin family protein n=1 Tax=Maribacter sp. TaxID=1897614 RepID=UPI0032979C63
MKNCILLIGILFFGSISLLNAQARPGIKLGVNNSNLSNTTLEDKKDLYIGAFVNIPLADYYALQPEILYSRQGGTSNSTEFGDVNINYIAVTAVNKFYVSPNKGFHFIIGLGLDFNVSSDLNILFGSNNDAFEISPVDLTFTGGIGYEFGFGLILEARYKQGAISTDFFGNRDLFEEDGSQLNSVIQVGLGYKFKIK